MFRSLRKLAFAPHPKRSFSQSSFESKMFLSSGLGMYKWLFSHSFAFKWGLDIIVSSFFLQNTLLMYSQPNFCFSRIIQADFQIFCTMDFRALSIAPLLGQKGHESLAVKSLLFSIATFFPGNKYFPYLNIGQHRFPKGGTFFPGKKYWWVLISWYKVVWEYFFPGSNYFLLHR